MRNTHIEEVWIDFIIGASFLVVILYAGMQLFFLFAFRQMEIDRLPNAKDYFSLSILVPFRDEKQFLEDCVLSLLRSAEELHSFEIILLDDHSSDGSSEIAKRLARKAHIKYVSCKHHGKKQALIEGNSIARYDWIFTADADCQYEDVTFNDLVSYANAQRLDVLTLPVFVKPRGGLHALYQFWDSLGLMLVTTVALRHQLFLSASGAAMLYRRADFIRLNPYQDNLKIASGDDQFLLYAFRQRGLGNIKMLKRSNFKVRTAAAESWQQLIEQRVRWASKSKSINDPILSVFLGLSVFANLMIFLLLALTWVDVRIIFCAMGVFVIKGAVEYVLLSYCAHFWKYKKEAKSLTVIVLFHPVIVLLIITNIVLRKPIIWKERYINHK